jgi:hypothetical protein
VNADEDGGLRQKVRLDVPALRGESWSKHVNRCFPVEIVQARAVLRSPTVVQQPDHERCIDGTDCEQVLLCLRRPDLELVSALLSASIRRRRESAKPMSDS